uniref:WD repeat and FYVE domain-containing protein 3 n=1 Tax=Globodera rostochiensis TaxID=31243 RepID=A0A914HM60_GLORO
MNNNAGGVSSPTDRTAMLATFRKNFAAFLKTKFNKNVALPSQAESDTKYLLVQFYKIMSHFTPDELCAQFKECLSFTTHIAEELVHEIRRRASSENTREAALAVYEFVRAEPIDARGWMLLKTVIFISNSGSPKVFECFCKTLLPNTLIKVAYLFMDLPDADSDDEAAVRRRLYDSLIMLIMNLCSQPVVAEELLHKDDLMLLFIGASSHSASPSNIWRSANFTFLCSVVAKALTAPVLKYINSRKCIAQYLTNIDRSEEEDERAVLLCNLLDLLRSSADSTPRLVDDFGSAGGFQYTVQFCLRGSAKNADQVLSALAGLITAGDQTIQFSIPQQSASSHFHAQKMVPTIARSTGTIRCMLAYKVLEQCFTEGEDGLCLLALEKVLHLLRAERMNYFVVDEMSSLFVLCEQMMAKGVIVQDKMLELVELCSRLLNYVPYKELSSLNSHLKSAVVTAHNFEAAERLLHFFLKIISVNSAMRDAFRELLILETFLHILQQHSSEGTAQTQVRRVLQLAMDLLISATKGNVLNAQFITENIDIKIAKTLLLAHQTDNEELKASIAILIKQLLYLAKNEQLFSSLLQLLFSEPEHIELCTVILKLFSNVLLESHKVRVMFRRSGGFILPPPSDAQQMPSLSLEFVAQRDATLQYVALIFHVLTVSMRYEPSNSKYFLNEVRPSIINSILLNLGCFGKCAKVDTDDPIWETITLANCGAKLAAIHQCFGMGTDLYRPEKRGNGRRNGALADLPHGTFNALIVMRLLLDLAFDNFEKSSNEFCWASANEWLQNVENLETVPVLAWSNSAVLAHPSAILSIVDLLPALCHPSNLSSGDCHNQNDAANTVVERPEADHTVAQLDEWSALAQLYIALTLKAILRSERNQQTMCQFDLPAKLLAVGEKLFKTDQHPLLSSFHYLFERLAYQSLRSSELRHFLRLDKPLCCTNLDDDDDEENKGSIVKAGGPIPIHRIKAFVSMLTPRNHSLLLSPAFVEFDLAIEGFAALVVPSLVRGGGKTNGGGGQHSQQQQQQSLGNAGGSSTPPATAADAEGAGGVTFPSSAGFTLAMWVNIVDFVGKKEPSSTTPIITSSPSPESASASSTICLFSIVRNCLQVLLQRVDYCWTLVVSGAEHSVADELRKDFSRGAEQCLQVPLSEQYFPPKQWAHLAVVVSKHSLLLKSSNMYNCEVFINGHSLATQKLQLCWHSADSNGQQPGLNAYIGTLPFFRRGSIQLRWRMASLCLVEEALGADVLRKMTALGVAYTGNYQTDVSSSSTSASSHSALIPEEKVLLSLNASASAETNVLSLRSMMPCRTEAELVAALVGISPNDQSTPLRLLWNITSCPVPCRPVPLGAVLIGYLGIRTFGPCPVSALLDSVGGMAPLLGTVVMSSDFSGLYASLKVLVCAVQTNRSVFVEMQRTRGFQTLAILLEDKASLMNSHILHLIFTLAGTVDDGSKEQVVIPNLQIFEDLLCDLDVWREAPREVWKLLLEHFFELLIETSASENLGLIRRSPLLGRLLVHLIENCSLFPVQNDISFRLIGAIVQPPCDGNSLLRLGQAIAATIAFDVDETAYPFSTAQLEQRLTAETASEERRDEIRDLHLYAVYARNRLLNILCTMLHHSNSQMNKELSTLIVDTLGFGWILAFCGPRVHHGTLFLAMRILANLLRYPSLVNKFRDGSANGGWLSDADSVIRNRAAVLLGFSVANQVGAVGAHVDINPELDKCSGFASLEHVAYSHANKPFVYLALLSVLFQQHSPNIQPLGNFTIEIVWSNVFGLDEQGSVADAIERAQFCPEIIVSLLATIRAAIHRQFEMEESNEQNANDWSINYPLRLLQFFNFLYQNSSQFFAICHTESFVVVLFSSLLPMQNAPQTPNSARTSAEECTATIAEECGGNRCVKQSLELLTNILLNDLCLANEARTEPLFDALIEYMDCNGPTHNRQNQLFTELVNGCLDHFMSSKMFFLNSASVPLVVPPSAKTQLNQSSEYTSANVVRFLSRVIDTVWNGLYKGNPIRILKCFLKLLAEAHASNKAAAQLQCTDAHISSLFRLILYLLSRPIDNVDTQMCVLDTLAEIVRNQQLFLTPKSNVDPLFYAALVHLVFMLSDRPQFDLQDRRNRELERGTAQVSICAQSVWGILWQHKKAVLEEWLKKGDLDLDLFTSRAKCGEAANRAWLQFVDSQTVGNNAQSQQQQDSYASARLLNAQKMLPTQLQTKLSRVARNGLRKLRNSTAAGIAMGDSSESKQWLNALARFDDERLRVEPETFYMWIRVHISLVRELIRNQCQRYHEWHAHVQKWCVQEWHYAEAELIRERGLWGPNCGSALNKFQLDITEGPCRIRRKLVPNPDFYRHYPYRPNLEGPKAKPMRAKVAISRDSKPYWERMSKKRAETMDERIVDFQAGLMPSPGGTVADQSPGVGIEQESDQPANDSVAELNISMIKRMVEKNLEHTEKTESIGEDVKRKRESEQNVVFDDDEVEEEEMDEEDEGVRDKSPKLAKQAEGTETAELELVEKTSVDGRKDICETEQKPLEMKKHHRRRDQSLGEPISQGPDNQTLLRLLEQGEKLHSMFRCARVQGLDIMEGLLLFGKDHFYVVDGFTLLKTREIRDLDFLPEQFHDPIIPYIAMGYRSRPLSTKVNRQCNKFAYDDIKEVHKRRYLLQQIALEVFSTDGRNFLLAFPRKVRDHVFQKLVSMAKNASSDVTQFMNEQKKLRPTETSSSLIAQLLTGQQQSITHKWLRGEISNFHYLMYLNTLAGRSYNDLSQYPVFPWVLADYDSDRLDLTNPASFRDFSMPMGAQNCDRLAQFLKRFREWDDPGGTPPYMYGTHYSSAMIVLSYLVRLEPFTQQFLKLQGGHFDLADRMFHSVRDAFWSAARNNMADVKELIPEFFFLPEMFLNENAFDLGVKQNGTQLDDVLLPPWANGDPHEFVRLHRQALECDFVSEHLHEWIDLIFGYKQTGDAAREANNVFHHLFYETSIDIETIEDPLTRNATLGFINNFGQIPAQLFKKQHPQRKIQGGHPPNALPLVSPVPGLNVPRLFYHCPEALRVSARPVKELRTAVGEIIVGERGNQAVVLEQNKVLVPPNSFLAWGFYDRSVRFGAVGNEKSSCILETNDVYEITCMATTDGRQVFAGLSTGTVFVWSFCLPAPSSSVSASLSVSKSVPNARLTPKRALSAHSDVVTALAANAAHNVLVSGSRDRTVIVWHLTRLGFIRQLAIHPGPVSAVAINEAKGDIATASGAWLFLWTINGTPLASVNTADSGGLFSNASSLVLCITFSMTNDWDENNVVLCGTSDGLVKMYSLERMSKSLNVVDEDRHSSKLADPNLELYQQQQSVREHLFRRQQRIQQHHHSFRMAKSPVKTAASLESSPSTSTVNSATFSRQTSQQPTTPTQKLNNNSSNNQHEQQQRDVQCPPIGMEAVQWRRTFRLRRILSEHTAFTAGNSQPAPITAIRATKDHRSLLIGDGIGRIWMWSIVGRSDSDGQPQQQTA